MSTPFLQIVFSLPLEGPFTYMAPEGDDGQERDSWIGRRVIAPFGKRSLTGYVIALSRRSPEGFTVKRINRFLDAEPLFGDREISMARWLSYRYLSTPGEALAAMLPGGRRETAPPSFSVEEEVSEKRVLSLSGAQEGALSAILSGDMRAKYLFGVTGSGKTEVFLRAAEDSIARGLGVIYLVPEISLSHQLVESIRGRFGGAVAVLHSGLTPSQRLKEWRRIRRGEALLAVGARSAVFAPMERLGMIIIDEEHEGSYKSGSQPRYHARQVAMHRCRKQDALLLMGSATPSVEAYAFMDSGRIERLDLPDRIAGGKMPGIDVVDMRMQGGAFSDELIAAIRKTKLEGKQSILFLNRRGFSYFFHCKSCSYQMTCKHCSVSLTLHKSSGRMVCHYCGWSRPPVQVCPECGSLDVGYSGFGTELVEEEIQRCFPDYSVERIDTDAVRKKGRLQSILDRFRRGEIDILLGTQMVAKGLNFPGVRLVGIVQADSSLHLPDFRSRERTFSLITQVAGRAGRYDDRGRVLLQTFTPEDPAVDLAARGELESFYRRELGSRKELGFPPYARLARMVFRGKKREEVEAECERAADFLETRVSGETEILGPSDCPIAVIAKKQRVQLILRAVKLSEIVPALHSYRSEMKVPSTVYVEYDIDPVSLL